MSQPSDTARRLRTRDRILVIDEVADGQLLMRLGDNVQGIDLVTLAEELGVAAGSFALVANNLSDLVSASAARSNLGLGSAATMSSAAFLQAANNLSDLSSAATARSNLGLGSAALLAASSVALVANNLSDLVSASAARGNLGLGTIATQAASAVALTGGAIDGIAIGATTPASGKFSSLTDTALTATRVPFVSTGGLLADSADMTFVAASGQLTLGNATATHTISSAVASTSTSTGALVIPNGGVGIGGILSVGSAARIGASGAAGSMLHLKQNGDNSTGGLRFERLSTTDYHSVFMSPGLGSLTDCVHFWPSFLGATAFAVDRTGIAYAASKILIGTTTDDGSSTLQVNGSLKLASVAAPTSVNGQVWNDSTQGSFISYQQSVKQSLDTTVGATGDISSWSNGTSETSLVPGSFFGTKTLPANFWKAGKHVRIEIHGSYGSLATPGNLTIRVKIGATTLQTLTITDLKASASASPYSLVVNFFCQASGVSGNFGTGGSMLYQGASGTSFGLLSTSGGTTINTTASAAVDVTAQWATASASNVIRTATCVISVCN